MDDVKKFVTAITKGYPESDACIRLGSAMLNQKVVGDAQVNIPLRSLNRHGLIAGATGTGKTKTVQLLAEKLSLAGVPSLLMDLKGDLIGLAAEGKPHKKIDERMKNLGMKWDPKGFPVELLTLSKEKGIRLRATVSEFGPLLFSKMLGLNDTQSGVVAVIFKFADDSQLPLMDLKDFRKCLNYCTGEGAKEIASQYGKISSASSAAILRKLVELEQQGADLFFCEPSFDVEDLMRTNKKGLGCVSILRLGDIQNKPKLFSTFMLSLLAETYQKSPEAGDIDKPKLAIFIDEAHLIFKNASPELLEQLEAIIKLIRSKGVGIFFCTQSPADIPTAILGQLGLKIQHALRAFTAKDRKAIKLAAENYPSSKFYETDELITSLGIGEALVTALSEKAKPTPLAATYLCAPQSRMGPLKVAEIKKVVDDSDLAKKYAKTIDRKSAYEMLDKKISQAVKKGDEIKGGKASKEAVKESKGWGKWLSSISKNTLVRQLSRRVVSEVARGFLGVLGV